MRVHAAPLLHPDEELAEMPPGERPETWELARNHRVDAVWFQREDTLAHREQWVMIFRQVALVCRGSRLAPAVEGEVALRLFRAGGGFWVCPTASKPRVSVGGEVLEGGEYGPLNPGADLCIGDAELRIVPFEQAGR